MPCSNPPSGLRTKRRALPIVVVLLLLGGHLAAQDETKQPTDAPWRQAMTARWNQVQGDASPIGGGIVLNGERYLRVERAGAVARLVDDLARADDAHIIRRALERAQVVGQGRGGSEQIPAGDSSDGGTDCGCLEQGAPGQRILDGDIGDRVV